MANKTSTLPFCPQCESLMNHAGSELECELCDYKETMTTKSKLRSTIYKATVVTDVNLSVVYDQSLRRTCKVQCANASCDSNDIEKWGGYTDDGILIQPDMVIINYHDREDRVNTYICRICKTTTLPSMTVEELLS